MKGGKADPIVSVAHAQGRRFYHLAGQNKLLTETVLPELCNLIFDSKHLERGKPLADNSVADRSVADSSKLAELLRARLDVLDIELSPLDIRTLSGGRGGSCIVNVGNERFACKQYLRGGMPGRLNRSRYLWTGWHRTRALREMQLLVDCHELDLPAARPVFCAVQRWGLIYRAILLTQWLEAAPTLAAVLSDRPLLEAEWQRLAAMLMAFFKAGIMHPDLNATNILLQDSRHPKLIDFDRGQHCDPSDPTWQVGMLKRLRRSLVKLQLADSDFHYDDGVDWSLLLAAIERVRDTGQTSNGSHLPEA